MVYVVYTHYPRIMLLNAPYSSY